MNNYIITQAYFEDYEDIISEYGFGVGTIVTQDEENRLAEVQQEQRGGPQPTSPPPNPPTGPHS